MEKPVNSFNFKLEMMMGSCAEWIYGDEEQDIPH